MGPGAERRVLLVAQAFPPHSTAGVEVYTFRLGKALATLGCDVLVFCAGHDLAAKPFAVRRYEHEGLPVVEVNNVHGEGTLLATWNVPAIDAVAGELLSEWRPRAVHFQHLLNLSAGVIREARRRGARTLLTLHDYWLSCPRDGLRMRASLELCDPLDHGTCARCLRDSPYLAPALQRRLAAGVRSAGLGGWLHHLHDAAPRTTAALLRAARRYAPSGEDLVAAMNARRTGLSQAVKELDLVLAPTAFARARGLEAGAPPERTRILPLGVTTRPPVGRRAGPRLRFGYVGTLAPHKGVHVLIEAFRGVSLDAATLDVHGSATVQPDYAARLRALALGDPRIRFHGAFPEGRQTSIFAELDAIVVPSLWWENSPIVVLEAVAAGLPVVASRTGGVSEVLPVDAGVLVAPADVGALRNALEALARGSLLGEAHAAWAVKSVEAGALELIELYAGTATGEGLTSSA